MKQMKKSKEVLTGSFDSSKVTRDVNDHVFKFIIRMIKRRKQKLKACPPTRGDEFDSRILHKNKKIK
jgi:hypothetical protein